MDTCLDEIITKWQDEIIEKMRESVQIDSVKSEAQPDAPYGAGPKKALEHALELGQKLGFKTQNVGNRVGWIEYGDGEEMVGVLGHLDVVPVGEGWNYPPFGAEIHDGNIYGRGIMDDKGPTIGAIYALKAIRDAGLPIDRRIRVMFGTDEECGSSCVRHYIETGNELPVIGFTPDADYPVIFAEKGMSKFVIGKKRTAKTTDAIVSLDGGIAPNVVIPTCTVTYANGEENEAIGISAHGGTPEKGVNAAYVLMKDLEDMEVEEDFADLRAFVLEFLEDTQGKALDIFYQDPEMGQTTVSLGLIHYGAEDISFTLDIRYPKNAEVAVVRQKLEEAAARYHMEVLDCIETPYLYVPKDSELVQKLMKVYKEKTGREDEPISIGGGTYAKAFKNMVAFGPEFLGDPDKNVHQPNEYAPIDKLMESVKIMAAAMYELAQK